MDIKDNRADLIRYFNILASLETEKKMLENCFNTFNTKASQTAKQYEKNANILKILVQRIEECDNNLRSNKKLIADLQVEPEKAFRVSIIAILVMVACVAFGVVDYIKYRTIVFIVIRTVYLILSTLAINFLVHKFILAKQAKECEKAIEELNLINLKIIKERTVFVQQAKQINQHQIVVKKYLDYALNPCLTELKRQLNSTKLVLSFAYSPKIIDRKYQQSEAIYYVLEQLENRQNSSLNRILRECDTFIENDYFPIAREERNKFKNKQFDIIKSVSLRELMVCATNESKIKQSIKNKIERIKETNSKEKIMVEFTGANSTTKEIVKHDKERAAKTNHYLHQMKILAKKYNDLCFKI